MPLVATAAGNSERPCLTRLDLELEKADEAERALCTMEHHHPELALCLRCFLRDPGGIEKNLKKFSAVQYTEFSLHVIV